MKELIKVIAFDADDTLWNNEPFFQEVEKQYVRLLEPYGTPKEISAALFQTEMNNLKILGYGAKAFTISMVETALRISEQKISADTIQQIIALGKSLLEMPIELLPGVKETLKVLKEQGKYKLVVATKGDLLDQENKLERSGLASYFDHIEVMSDKTEKEYLCIKDGEEKGFTASEFKTAQKQGWEKQYRYKVGKKKEYLTPSSAHEKGYERPETSGL